MVSIIVILYNLKNQKQDKENIEALSDGVEETLHLSIRHRIHLQLSPCSIFLDSISWKTEAARNVVYSCQSQPPTDPFSYQEILFNDETHICLNSFINSHIFRIVYEINCNAGLIYISSNLPVT